MTCWRFEQGEDQQTRTKTIMDGIGDWLDRFGTYSPDFATDYRFDTYNFLRNVGV